MTYKDIINEIFEDDVYSASYGRKLLIEGVPFWKLSIAKWQHLRGILPPKPTFLQLNATGALRECGYCFKYLSTFSCNGCPVSGDANECLDWIQTTPVDDIYKRIFRLSKVFRKEE